MSIPKIHVLDRNAIVLWGAHNSFYLTFEEASQFIHDLQNAMVDQRYLETKTEFDFFILVIPEKI